MSTVQLTFWEKTIEESLSVEVKDCRNDITQLRKSMFARHGEMMRMMADLQKQINQIKEVSDEGSTSQS